MTTILSVQQISRHFGGLQALSDVGFEVQEKEVLGIIGPNGAGKTTLFNIISGYHRPSGGRVFFRGKNITGLKPHTIARKGIVRTFQASKAFKQATILENVQIGCHLSAANSFFGSLVRSRSYRDNEKVILARSLEILKSFGLEDIKDELALNLPYGHQKILGVCMGLGGKPDVLLLDEPVAGMNIGDTEKVMEHLSEFRSQGVTILMVEHDMKAVMNYCDRIVVLDFGKKIAEGKPGEISQNRNVIEAYLGVDESDNGSEGTLGSI